MTTTQAATNAAAKRLTDERMPALPRPAVTYADHSYPAFNAPQMRDYARTVLASLAPAGLETLTRYTTAEITNSMVGKYHDAERTEYILAADVERWAASHAGGRDVPVPADVRAALDRMCQPLDKSWLSGATAEADARCMAIIKRHIEGATPTTAAVPDVIREAVEAAFEDREGWRTKIATAVRALGKPAQSTAAVRAAATDAERERVRDAIAETLGDAYDCLRVWSAWGVGTMGPDDFVQVAEQDERLDEITDAVFAALAAAPATDVCAAGWISVEDRLPEDGDVVLIKTNRTNVRGARNQLMQHHVATFCKGRTAAEVARDRIQSFADEGSNNLRPYRWDGDGPCSWFGQDVTHWMPLPAAPATDGEKGEA